jgi:hypothetical protein
MEDCEREFARIAVAIVQREWLMSTVDNRTCNDALE